MRNVTPRQHAFSLIELTLAIFVFSVGVLTVFLLLGRGLEDGQATGRYTRMTQFGEDVMEALEERSEYYCETPGADGGNWYRFWQSFSEGSTSIVVAAGSTNGVWEESQVVVGEGTHTNLFVLHPWYSEGSTGVVSHAIRYRVKVQLDPLHESAPAFTTWTNLARVTLRVWEGQYGRFDDRDSVLLYAWFADHGAVQ